MHPNRAFHTDDDDAWLEFADAHGFAHIFAGTPDGQMVVHAPVSRFGAHTLRFHIARGNRLCRHLDGAHVLVSLVGVDGYISPNWYADHVGQVPTWNYAAAEIEGVARLLDDDGLVEQLDALAARHEPRVNPTDPWHRDKMDDVLFRRMLGGIRGFEIAVDTIRATAKLSQNKSSADRAGAITGLRASGHAALADAMSA